MTTTATQPAASSYSEGFFSSPSDLARAAVQANQAVTNIDNAVQGSMTTAGNESTSTAPEAWIESWDQFKLEWQSWYNSTFASGDFTSWISSDLLGGLEGYQQQISSFAAQAAGYGISIPGGVPNVPTGGPLDWLPSGGTVLGALALVALIVVAWKVL